VHTCLAREALGDDRLGPQLKQVFGGVYIANERCTQDLAEQAIAAGEADAVAFGKAFIANPDLVWRFAQGAPLNTWDAQTFYSQGPQSYTDYPPAV
jgi:2,4-dienoyl-CoA reductase-like NADH-dependent reductase (Old Yellow Enzyme family)